MHGLHTNKIAALFPPPEFLSMPSAGIDISDTSIKYLDAQYTSKGLIPRVFDSVSLKEGVVVDGVVRDTDALSAALKELYAQNDRRFANVSLPEELVYLYTLEIPTVHGDKEIMQVIEFSLSEHAPIPAENAMYNYDIIRRRGEITEISVTVFPKDVVKGYLEAFQKSGFQVKVFELEARSLARSVTSTAVEGVSMIIDFGRTRTGITIALGQIPIFSTTVKIGGDAFTESIVKHHKVSDADADTIKLQQGIVECTPEALCQDLITTTQALVKEIQRHYRYWNTRKDEEGNNIAPIERIFLCGGAVGVKGLPEHVSDVLHVPVEIGNVWENMFSLDEHIPHVSRVDSWRYATAAGLLLRDVL
tara:strand:- start:4610 stop:5695 length:1086 start_codon:yes stop_codon:yes gene_type:complete